MFAKNEIEFRCDQKEKQDEQEFGSFGDTLFNMFTPRRLGVFGGVGSWQMTCYRPLVAIEIPFWVILVGS